MVHRKTKASRIVGAWSWVVMRSDGRLGPVSLLVMVLSISAIWRTTALWSSEEIHGSVTALWSMTGIMALSCMNAVRMRIHDMAEGGRTRAVTVLIGVALVACIVQTQQQGRWPDIGAAACLMAWAVVLLRRGVDVGTRHGPRPAPGVPTFPTTRPATRSLAFAACWMALSIGLGAFVEQQMHQYRDAVDRRNAVASSTGTGHDRVRGGNGQSGTRRPIPWT